jgi:SAM-dependent methyltransferase
VTDVWSGRAEGYRTAVEQREGEDLDLIVAWCQGAETVLDVATGGGHVARRLRAAGHDVITCDPAPGMHPDVICRAEDLPFAESSFDVVVTRIAPHHFADIEAAVAAMARVARRTVIVEDTLYTSDDVEAGEKLRDPTHVRSYTEAEWRSYLERAGLVVEEVTSVQKTHPCEAWLARTGCTGAEAERVRELLAPLTSADGESWTDTKIMLRARKETP